MENEFPVFKAGHIFNKFKGKFNGQAEVKLKEVEIFFPCRLDAMAINPAGVCYNNEDMVFTPGEVVISIGIGLKVFAKVIDGKNQVRISPNTKRKVLVKHAYFLMLDIFKELPSLYIDVDSSKVLKHCGFGSSSSTLASVCSAINEIMGHKIKNDDLIKYLASNHGEEVSDDDEDNLKAVQCIGGGATGGLTNAGIMLIAGKATKIARMKYTSNVLIGIPNTFVEKDAKTLMELEEQNLWKFEKTGKEYKDIIAYNLLHKALPAMANGEIDELAKVVYEYRFFMGSNLNCSFVCDDIVRLNETLKPLFEEKHCQFLALSSVGPAFFVLCKDKNDLNYCKQFMESQDMKTVTTKVFNTTYKVLRSKK